MSGIGYAAVAREFLKTAGRHWLMVMFLTASSVYGFVAWGFWTGLGWALADCSFVAALWFAEEARAGWTEALRVSKEATERMRAESARLEAELATAREKSR
jgi:hypothetical protein